MSKAWDVEREWESILANVIQPLEDALDGKESMLKEAFVKAYTAIYQMSSSSDDNARYLYEGCERRIEHYLSSVVLTHMQQIVRSNAPLLEEFKRRKDNHDIMMKWYNSVFLQLQRSFLPKHHLPSLMEVGSRLYRDIVFRGLSGAIAQSILRVVEQRRQGVVESGQGDASVLKGCIDIFIDMKMYEEILEPSIIQQSRAECRAKAAQWIDIDSTSTYLHKVQNTIDDVLQSVAVYLPNTTEPKLLNTIDSEMIMPYSSILAEKESGCMFLFREDKWDDVSLMFNLFSKVSHTPVICDFWSRFLQTLITDKIIAQYTEDLRAGSEEKDKASEANSKLVDALLQTWEKYERITGEVYGNALLFVKALKDSFTCSLRCEEARAILEAMCTYCDRELKKKLTVAEEEREVERKLDSVIALLGFMDDKDFFMEIYRLQLSKRLLTGTVTNNDLERTMVSKMKIAMGAQIALKLEGMLSDISTATEASFKFKEYAQSHSDRCGDAHAKLEVKVFTGGHWPTMIALENMRLPSPLLVLQMVFSEFYTLNFSNRRLAWILSQGSVELSGFFPGKRPYTLDLAPPQAALLLTCNPDSALSTQKTAEGGNHANNVFSFTDLKEATNLGEDVLKKVLHSLACGKHKILKKISASTNLSEAEKAKESKVIKTTDSFQLNDKFSSPQTRFKVPMPSLESNAATAKQLVDDSRTYQIEAAVVRIMKARKTLNHQALISEVLGQLSMFKPDPRQIKKSIESLIEREYLERNVDVPNSYNYLA